MTWKQLASIPESLLKARILAALDIEPPPEGVSRVYQDSETYMEFTLDGSWVVCSIKAGEPQVSRGFPSDQGSAALRATKSPPGTPSGDALRSYMRTWGWVSAKARP